MRILAGVLAVLVAWPAIADAPSRSLRPVARGEVAERTTEPLVTPEDLGVRQEDTRVEPERKRRGLFALLRPKDRPSGVEQKGRRVEAARRKNMVCSDPGLQGIAVGRVSSSVPGCGVDEAVRISSVSGVALSTHAVMDCVTANRLKYWVENGMRDAVGKRGGGVSQLQVAAHYACRPRNNQKGARVSEHGKGHAIDISGFVLRDGSTIDVLTGWNDRRDGKILRRMHDAACGPFGTVLGPNSDRFHRNHFHFDTARYRSGAYCR